MASVLQPKDNRESLLAWLSPCGFSSPNHEWFSCMLASWYDGQGVLPDYLGLQNAEFEAMQQHFFPHCTLSHDAASAVQLDATRMLEKEDLINLLKQYRRDDNIETDWVIALLVAACLGNDHLWQDLGLWSRTQIKRFTGL
ncbi:nitrogen fixation protein NifQ [Methylocucumis oryzae]|uniref:nitrogen fixation protein NifQ n=1 Tax=Methylocucumis oryzae TaxID=1632867 RepID=UPI000B09473C|nr:nitrogen fixation protein NifQ [Methylocucumis oryzae]